MNNNRTQINFAGNDKLITRLMSANAYSLCLIVILAVLISVIPIVQSMLNGNFINPKLDIDAVHDIGYIQQFLFLTPLFLLFIPFYFRGFENAIIDLLSSKITESNTNNTFDLSDYSKELFSRKFFTYFPYLFSIVITIYGIFAYSVFAPKNTWGPYLMILGYKIPSVTGIVPILILYYLVSAFIIRLGAIYYLVKVFFEKNNIKVQPLHFDNCGGLKPLGDFSLRISYAGLAMGVFSLTSLYFNYYYYKKPLFGLDNLIILFGYFLGLTIAFFLPLLPARKYMKEAKNSELRKIGDFIEDLRTSIMKCINRNDDEYKQHFGKFKDLTDLYDIAKKMPVYPFNLENVVKFFGSILWPLIVIFIEALISDNL